MIPPFMIVVECLSAAAVCAAIGMPDLGANNYPTQIECNRALIEIASNWNPGNGAYSFTCRRWPW